MADEVILAIAAQLFEHTAAHEKAQTLEFGAAPQSDLERETDQAAGLHARGMDDLRHALAAFRAESLAGAFAQLFEAWSLADLHVPREEKADRRRLEALFGSALRVLREHLVESDLDPRLVAEAERMDPWRALERAEALAEKAREATSG